MEDPLDFSSFHVHLMKNCAGVLSSIKRHWKTYFIINTSSGSFVLRDGMNCCHGCLDWPPAQLNFEISLLGDSDARNNLQWLLFVDFTIQPESSMSMTSWTRAIIVPGHNSSGAANSTPTYIFQHGSYIHSSARNITICCCRHHTSVKCKPPRASWAHAPLWSDILV